MKKAYRGLTLLAVIAPLGLVPASSMKLAAQSGTRYGGDTRSREASSYQREGNGTRQAPQRSFERRFWDYLQAVRYENWAPIPGNDGDFFPGQSPHGEFVKVYVNRTAAGQPKDMPHGSIVIKENFGGDKQTLMAITVMYRAKGYDPEHGDWYWVKYEPDGRVSQMQGMPVAGKLKMCIACHDSAGGSDYVFGNEE